MVGYIWVISFKPIQRIKYCKFKMFITARNTTEIQYCYQPVLLINKWQENV